MSNAFDALMHRLHADGVNRNVLHPTLHTPKPQVDQCELVAFSTGSPYKNPFATATTTRLVVKINTKDLTPFVPNPTLEMPKATPSAQRDCGQKRKVSERATRGGEKRRVNGATKCLVLYGTGPMLRHQNRVRRLLVYAENTDITAKKSEAECEWRDVPELVGQKFRSMNAACEGLRKLSSGNGSKSARLTVNVWTNLSLTPEGGAIDAQRKSGKGFAHFLQPVPSM